MSAIFSRRHGYGECSKELKYETAPEKLRIGLWNLIEDYEKRSALPGSESLYTRLTAHFRLERSGANYQYEIKQMVMTSFKWFEIFNLIEFLFVTVQYYDYDESEREWVVYPGKVGDARYQYTKDINALLSSENMGWKLKKGQLERLGSEVLDREVVEKARKILLNPDFAGPNNQFNKALEFFSKRPKPDLVNCVKEAVCALEGFVRILLKDDGITLGEATNQLVGKKILRKPLDKPFHALYGFVSSEPGSRHGAHILPTIDLAETEYVLYNSAVCMLLLAKKYEVISVEENKTSERPSKEDDIPDTHTEEETPDFPVEEELPEFPDDDVPF